MLFLVFFLKTLDNRENDFSRFICLSPCRLDLFLSAPSVSPFSEKENFPTYQPCLRLPPPMSQWRWQFPLILLLPFLPLFSFFSVYRRVNISCELFLFLFPPSVRPFGGRRAEQTCTKKVRFLQLFFSLTASPLSRGGTLLLYPPAAAEGGRAHGRTDGRS